MNMCTRWWLHDCLKCQAQNKITTDGPLAIISMPLPEGPGNAVSDIYLLTLPATSRVTDRLSRRADMIAVTEAMFTDDVTANIFLNRHVPLRGCRRSIRSDKGLQVCLKLLHAVDIFVGFRLMP